MEGHLQSRQCCAQSPSSPLSQVDGFGWCQVGSGTLVSILEGLVWWLFLQGYRVLGEEGSPYKTPGSRRGLAFLFDNPISGNSM